MVALTHRPTAVFAGNDMMAIGCLSALNEAGLRVPHDVALAGFDDIPISRYVNPPLTTVRARIAELGGLALERLASAIEEPARTAIAAPDAARRPGRAPVDDLAARATFLRPLPRAA